VSDSSDPHVGRALVNPVGLGVVAGAATVAIALANPIVGAIGGGAYVVSVLIDAIRRGRKKSKRKLLFSGIDPDAITDPDMKAAVLKIIAARERLQKVIDETPPDVLLQLQQTMASLDEMQSYAASLIERSESTAKYLASVNLPALVQEVKTLAQRAAAAKDQQARASFDEAKNARMDEIRSLKDLRANKERVEANLMRVVAVLGALPTKIVRLRALDAQAMEQLSGDLTHDLTAMGEELKTSEKVIREMVPA
jgi:hypothetical protein